VINPDPWLTESGPRRRERRELWHVLECKRPQQRLIERSSGVGYWQDD
jgi:hypothetical protein